MIKVSDPVIPDDITDECAELLRKLLIKDPSRRPTVAALRTDDWVTLNGIDPLPDQSGENLAANVMTSPCVKSG